MRVVALAAAVALALAGCGRCDRANSAPTPSQDSVALRVGPYSYTVAEVELKTRIVADKYPDYDKPKIAAYAQLIENTIALALLARLGQPITDAELDAEIARIDRETRMPDRLEALKQICGGGSTPGYRRIAILPDFANKRFFFEVYPLHPEIHRETFESAQRALHELREGRIDSLALAGAETGWRRDDLLYATERGFYRDEEEERAQPPDPNLPPEVRPGLPAQDGESAQYEREVFEATPEREWHPRVIAEREAWVLLRWVGWKDEAARVRKVERLSLPKRDAHDYFWEQAREVPVEIANEADRREFERVVGWAEHVRWVGEGGR